MNIPGFTAEASLPYRTAHRGRGRHLGPKAAGIIPQLRRTDYECVHDCLEAGAPTDICNFFCTESEGEGGGGPRDPVCTPSCSPCRRVAGQPGRWKTCILRNCDDRMIRCA
jgi:hypothetical protein